MTGSFFFAAIHDYFIMYSLIEFTSEYLAIKEIFWMDEERLTRKN